MAKAGGEGWSPVSGSPPLPPAAHLLPAPNRRPADQSCQYQGRVSSRLRLTIRSQSGMADTGRLQASMGITR